MKHTRVITSLYRLILLPLIVFLISCNGSSQNSPATEIKGSPSSSAPLPPLFKKPIGPVIEIPDTIVTGAPNEKRVQEIVKHLEATPKGLGKPITDRAAWVAAYPNPETFLTSVAATMNDPIPDAKDELYLLFTQTGDRDKYQAPFFKRVSTLQKLALAECIENKGRFLPAIENYLATILAEKTWTMPAHDPRLEAFKGEKMIVDLGACMRSWDVATIDYILGSKLRPETRAKIRSEVNRRVLDPYKKVVMEDYTTMSKGSKWWLTTTNNWNAVCHAGVIGSALALIPSVEERAWYLAAMEIHIPNFLAGFTPDGYCTEGIGYWNYGFGHYVMLAETVGEATQWYMNLYAPKRVSNILYFPKRLELLPNLYPAFADCSSAAKPEPWIYQIAGRRVSTETPLPTKHTLNPMGGMFYQIALLAFSEYPETSSPQTDLPIRSLFPDSGIALSRTVGSTLEKGFGLCIKANHNDEHHNHNDEGSFVIGYNGKTPIVDPGAEVYTKRTFSPQRYESQILNSYGHSVPIVAGKLQDSGKSAYATLTVVETSDAKDVYLLDLKPAYIKSVPSLKKLTRRATFTRSPKLSVEIVDEVEFDSPQTFGNALLTFWKCMEKGNNTYVIYDGLTAMQIKVDAEGKAFSMKDEFLEGNLGSSYKARRLGFNLNEPVTQARIRQTFEITSSPVSSNPVLDKDMGEARKPRIKDAITVEAEKFSDQKGGTVENTVKVGSSGEVVKLWDKDSHELTWKFKIPTAGTYGVLLRYANGAGSTKRILLVDNLHVGGIQGEFIFEPTGGWGDAVNQWKESWLAQSQTIYGITLAAGEHSVTLRNVEGGGLNLDWIALVPLDK